GPIPGLALGLILAVTQPALLAGIPQLVPMLIGLNLLNLLPMEPLDGGRLAGLLVFGSFPRFGIILSAMLAIVFVATLGLDATVQGAIVGGIAGAQIVRWQAATVAERLRADGTGRWVNLPGDLASADDSMLRALF